MSPGLIGRWRRSQQGRADSIATMTTRFSVNGEDRSVEHPPGALLLDVVRGDLGLSGTKWACGRGECGACTVIIDGAARMSCITLVGTLGGARVETVEGIAAGTSALRRSFADRGGFQCGFCTPGQVVAAEAALRLGVDPADEHALRLHLSGNVCRCTGYVGIVDSVLEEAERRAGS